MRCSKCGAENPDRARFCVECAAPFARRCASCGAENPPQAKFCLECSKAMGSAGAESRTARQAANSQISVIASADAALDGERKIVTALFADIKGSTELEHDLDPEEARWIVDPALKLMINAVRRYDGYIVQSTGDGVFALFGAPIAHEDHPQRALYAALRMHDEIRHYADKLRADGRSPLQIRIGADTGEVVVRTIETGGKTEYAPIGHAANLASRMQSLANPGSTVISESTRKLVEGYFTLQSLGTSRVKGITESVNVYEVTGLGPIRTRLQRSAGRGYTKFVGRQREMDAMKRAAEQAKAGHGQIVAAIADAGVGKSRLIFEYKARSQSGWLVLDALSLSHDKASAYVPLIDLLHVYFRVTPDDDARTRREKVAGKIAMLDRSLEQETLPHLFALLGIVEGEDPLAQIDAQTRRRRTQEAVKRILLRESLNQPLMLIFEDLHWIDEETQAFLNLLVDGIANVPVLLLVNYRPEYTHQWGSKTYYTQLRLDPLGKESAEEMLSALLGNSVELAPLKRLIIEKTEGNPLFMEEIYQALIEDESLKRNRGVKLVRPVEQLRLPPTVQGILAARIDHLQPEEKELLQTLAVIGTEVQLSLVRQVVKLPPEPLDRLLSGLQTREFIFEQPVAGDVEYSFKHALTRQVANESLLNERRKLLHERTAEAIEALYADRLEDHYGDLARHYSRAGESAKAVHYLYLAGEQALARFAYIEALAHLTSGLELLKTLPEGTTRDRQELRMQLALGLASFVVNGPASNQIEAAFSRAYELCHRSGETPDLVSALGGLTRVHLFRGAVRKAREASQETLEVAGRIQDPAGAATAHYTLGMVLQFQAELAPARERLEQSLGLLESASDPSSLLRRRLTAPVHLGRALWLLGFPDQALERTREAEEAGRRSTDPQAKSFGLALTQEVHVWCRNFDVVREHAQTFLDAPWATEVNPGLYRRSEILRGWLIAREGQSQGIALMRGAMVKLASMRSGLYASLYASLLAEACASVGHIDEALAALDEALPFAETEEHYYEAELHRLRGELLLTRTDADREAAERCFRKAIDIARRQSAKSWELRAAISFARLLHDTGRRDEARSMLSEVYNWFTEGFDTLDLKDAKVLLDELGS